MGVWVWVCGRGCVGAGVWVRVCGVHVCRVHGWVWQLCGCVWVCAGVCGCVRVCVGGWVQVSIQEVFGEISYVKKHKPVHKWPK